MKKVILMAAASLAIFATSFAQNATAPAPTAAPAPKAKMTKSTKPKPAMDAPAQGTPATAATPATGEKGKGKGHGEAHGEGKAQGGGMNDWGLTPEQSTQFKSLNTAHKAAVQAVQKDAGLAADAKKAQVDALKSKYESDVQGVLNADQFAKWKAARAKGGEKKQDMLKALVIKKGATTKRGTQSRRCDSTCSCRRFGCS